MNCGTHPGARAEPGMGSRIFQERLNLPGVREKLGPIVLGKWET